MTFLLLINVNDITAGGYCFECDKPCKRFKELIEKYERTRGISLMDNFERVKQGTS